MINQTLQEAVTNEILNVLVPTKSSFSFHDITIKIRERVNTGEIDVTDSPDITINGVKSRRITNDDVKTCVQIVLQDNNLVGYKKRHSSLPNGGGYYTWVYDANSAVPSSVPAVGAVSPAMPSPVPVASVPASLLFADDV